MITAKRFLPGALPYAAYRPKNVAAGAADLPVRMEIFFQNDRPVEMLLSLLSTLSQAGSPAFCSGVLKRKPTP